MGSAYATLLSLPFLGFPSWSKVVCDRLERGLGKGLGGLMLTLGSVVCVFRARYWGV